MSIDQCMDTNMVGKILVGMSTTNIHLHLFQPIRVVVSQGNYQYGFYTVSHGKVHVRRYSDTLIFFTQ